MKKARIMDDQPAAYTCKHSCERDALKEEIYVLRHALKRAQNVLNNMAKENEGAIFFRWPINHEPLRADARNLLPIIDEALNG